MKKKKHNYAKYLDVKDLVKISFYKIREYLTAYDEMERFVDINETEFKK